MEDSFRTNYETGRAFLDARGLEPVEYTISTGVKRYLIPVDSLSPTTEDLLQAVFVGDRIRNVSKPTPDSIYALVGLLLRRVRESVAEGPAGEGGSNA